MRTQSVESLIEKLKASEQRYQSFIANSSEQIWCVEFDSPVPLDLPESEQMKHVLDQGYYVECNEAFAKAYGATCEEVVDWRLEDTLPRDQAATNELLRDVVRSRFCLTDLESHEVAKDGSERIIINNLIGIVEDNVVHRVWGTARDVTQFRTTEKAIELRSIAIETMRDGCIIVDAMDDEMPIVYSNKQFTKITGYPQQEVAGRNCRFLQGPDTCPRMIEEMREAIQRKEAFSGEVLNYRKDGKPFVNYLRLTPVFQTGGVLTHYVGIQSDITARRSAEALLEEKSKALEVELLRGEKARGELENLTERLINAQEDEKRHLARELHDDLTQRLAALAMEVGSLEGSSPAAEVLSRVSNELTKLAGATQEFSRQLHPSIINDLGIARALGAECRRFGRQAGIGMKLVIEECDSKLPSESSLCVYRILQESLSNISKHANASLVVVEFFTDAEGISLRIQDDGVGFDLNKTSGSHTLGLVSMSERARYCGGQFSIESTRGSGTTVFLKLPNAPSSEI